MQITIKPYHIVIVSISLITFLLGGFFAFSGMPWYQTLHHPIITPPHFVFAWVWRIIFLLTTIAVIRIWNSFERDIWFWVVNALFAVSALLNIHWNYLFFYQHRIGAALINSCLLEISTLALILIIRPKSRTDALLLIPGAAWLIFAIVLNFLTWLMN